MKIPREIEFKYRADNISLIKFKEFCEARPTSANRVFDISGFDHFYENIKDPEAFARHRVGPGTNQLTFKRKLNESNNYIREEVNTELAEGEKADKLLSQFGFKYTASIFKTCFIYLFDFYTLVYYIVYDSSMKELGRFLEIEAGESYPWANDEEAYQAIVDIEKLSKSLGISPQGRVKRSLFELFGEQT